MIHHLLGNLVTGFLLILSLLCVPYLHVLSYDATLVLPVWELTPAQQFFSTDSQAVSLLLLALWMYVASSTVLPTNVSSLV